MMILQLRNLSTLNHSFQPSSFYHRLFFLIYGVFCSAFAIANDCPQYKFWELNVAPIIKGMPQVDNGDNISGGRIAVTNFFYNYKNTIEVGLDLSAAYLKTSREKVHSPFSKSISIFSPAIIGRWNIIQIGNIQPYVSLGIGPSYLSNSDFEGRSLGNNFSFQDIAGVGLKINGQHEFTAGLYMIHYSNGGLKNENRGITTPLFFQFGYRI